MEDIVKSLGYLVLGTRLKRLAERLQSDTQEIIAAEGLTISAPLFTFLAAIDRLRAPAVGELAAALGVTQPAATKSLAQLAREGFVTLAPGADDQRQRIAQLTEKGRATVEAGKARIWRRVERAVADLCDGLEGPLLAQLAQLESGLADRSLAERMPQDGGMRDEHDA